MTERKRSESQEFVEALESKAAHYNVNLDRSQIARFQTYFELIQSWNPRLHLVSATLPEEFAARHVLESLAALPFLVEAKSVVDIGSGAGLPIIPCLIKRVDLQASLIESSKKKAVFLHEVISRLNLQGQARVHAERFENLPPPHADALTCRALEHFVEQLPSMIAWAREVPQRLLFGGPGIRTALDSLSLTYEASLLPQSEQRFIFVVSNVEPQKKKR